MTPVSFVVHAGDAWEPTRAVLDAVRGRMGPRDEAVVVVGAGAPDEVRKGLARYSWARVATDPASAAGEIVVSIPAGTVPPGRSLTDLVAVFEDPEVAAAGPRTNVALGPQGLGDAQVPLHDPAAMRVFARDWREAHKGSVTDVEALEAAGFAVRRADLEAVGGALDGPVEVCRALRDRGRRVVVADAALLLSAAHAVALVSACLIVRDEEDKLGDCLESLKGVADEVVVYDTGSVDDTVEVARRHGATVVEGYWDDDFGRARNAALDHCTGEWVLHVDADEVVEGDPSALRALLARADGTDKFNVAIDNLDDEGRVAFTHEASRIFRRRRAHWEGALHEQVAARPGQAPLTNGKLEEVRLRHSGYADDAVSSRHKLERNLRLAKAELERGSGHRPYLLLNYARSASVLGDHAAAVEALTEARRLGSHSPVVTRQVLRHGAETLLRLARHEEAIEWAGELRKTSTNRAMADFVEGMALANLGRLDEAAALLAGIDDLSDDDGTTLSAHLVPLRRAMVFVVGGQWADAVPDLTSLVLADEPEPMWALTVEAHWRGGVDMATLAEAVPEDRLTSALGQVLNAPPEAADAFAQALWADRPDHLALVAFAIRLAPRLDVLRAMEWAIRVRAAGLSDRCPLVALAGDRHRTPSDRLRASVSALAAFSDERARLSMALSAADLPPEEFAEVLVEVGALAPNLLPELVMAVATDAPRSLAMGQALHELGATDQGAAVVVHGYQGQPEALRAQAARWLEEIGQAEAASTLRVGSAV